MRKKRKHNIHWNNIYSLGLLPAILTWALSPILDDLTIIIISIIVGIIWTIASFFSTRLSNGCGTIGWITGWAMISGGMLCLIMHLLNISYPPIILFEAPVIALLSYLFKYRDIQPPFCHQCIVKRGGIRERHLLGDFTRYEAYFTIRLILFGSLFVAALSWILFFLGIKIHSRGGVYFYFYFPTGLGVALILFEVTRRWLIQLIINKHEKGVRDFINKNNSDDRKKIFDVVRILLISQEKIYLIENQGDKYVLDSGKGLDLPIHRYFEHYFSLAEEKKQACQIVQEELHIEKPDLRRLNSVTSDNLQGRVGHYILFLPEEDMYKANRYPGRWYTVEEITRLFYAGRLYPLFRENYARFYTIVRTALTYYPNGRRRFPIQGYKPSFSLRKLDQMDIEFDDPIWLYVSRHNEDRVLYRIDLWFQKILTKLKSSNCCDA